jgi:predicted helicase
VFDIRQGVSIIFFIKSRNRRNVYQVHYKDLRGNRESKYSKLADSTILNTNWEIIDVTSPYYFFVPKDFSLFDEYVSAEKIDEVFSISSSGMNTLHDNFVINFNKDKLIEMIDDACKVDMSNKVFIEKYKVNNSRDWKIEECRDSASNREPIEYKKSIRECVYRPFDYRWILLHDDFVGYPRWETTAHMLNDSAIGFVTTKQSNETISCLCSNKILGQHKIVDPYHRSYVFPLFIFPSTIKYSLFDMTSESPWIPDVNHGNRVPNLDPGFVRQMEDKLGLSFDPHLAGREHELQTTFGPEDILAYIYAIFHAPTYRERYAEFLKIDFPRVPLTADANLFRNLVALGRELIALHLMESPRLNDPLTSFPIPGDSQVAPRGGYPKYAPPEGGRGGRVYINREQYFEGVLPEVWAFEIGGYQVLHKWLKDRRGRTLSYDDKRHYQQVVVSLKETIRLMEEIDAAIPGWPLE